MIMSPVAATVSLFPPLHIFPFPSQYLLFPPYVHFVPLTYLFEKITLPMPMKVCMWQGDLCLGGMRVGLAELN